MFKHFYKYYLLLVVFAFANNIVIAQQQLNELKASFTNYTTDRLQEKLFLHVDKSIYTVGEIVWFKIYAVDGFLNQPLSLSKIAYVEIISNEAKPVLQAKISLDSGSGNGSFLLPA